MEDCKTKEQIEKEAYKRKSQDLMREILRKKEARLEAVRRCNQANYKKYERKLLEKARRKLNERL